MVTYVNSVLISNLASGAVLSAAPAAAADLNTPSDDAGKWVVMTLDNAPVQITKTTIADSTTTQIDDPLFPYIGQKAADTTYSYESNAAKYNKIKIGVVTSKNSVQHGPTGVTYQPIVKWTNVIDKNDIKSYKMSTYAADTKDVVVVDFNSLDAAVLGLLNDGGKRLITRLTFKDLPTRYRKWTESYEYVTSPDDTKATIAANIAEMINKEWKRARVNAFVGTVNSTSSASGTERVVALGDGTYFHVDANWGTSSATTGTAVMFEALPYDDDNAVDTLNWDATVRFNVNVYYTDPAAEGWASKNKFFPTGVVIKKNPGKKYTASAKLVRDREAQAMGYLGILNRGEGTWPIIKPEMETDLSAQYDAITLEFETTYHAADDIVRKTKQTAELYGKTSQMGGLNTILAAFVA